MLAPSALFKGIVARWLPAAFVDDRDTDKPVRLDRYGGPFTQPMVRKTHALADEGSYFVTHNAQTGIAAAAIATAFAQTTLSPFLHIVNTDSGEKGKSIYLDYANLICTAGGTAASGLTNAMFAWSIDTTSRYTSGGTDITGAAAAGGGTFSPNSAGSRRSSISQIYAGALTLAAASANARIVVPQRLLRVQNSGTAFGALQDEVRMNFGGVEHPNPSSIVDLTTAKTVAYREHFQLPPIVIAPGHNATLHLWSPGAAVSGVISYLPELGHWER